jgi:hypothetical protein
MAVDMVRFFSGLNLLGGVARTNAFVVEIATPPGLKRVADARYFSLLCEGTNLPGINVGLDDRFLSHGYGVPQRMPWGVNFTDTNFSFYADNKGKISQMLHEWINQIVRFNDPDFERFGESPLFIVNYRKEYATDVVIKAYDQSRNTIMEYTLHDAFPATLYDQSVTWSDKDQLQRIVCRMVFTRWSVKHNKLSIEEEAQVSWMNREISGVTGLPYTGKAKDTANELNKRAGQVSNLSRENAGARYIENAKQAVNLITGEGTSGLRV